ncbi:glycosyltransferase family 2 protein [Natrinema salaciae]|uniref:Glycosyltransferase involved in cell wall bisynthesis n=1 Tax=Natrinema salaciae TaxID=1186196 RepID=A0A1H9MV34_9EURY|nr:glycosyltransferase family 2 protein [Natrinema salaciae]SER27542.1 Glycosyltransferase involved in cell wall bisynthesis [Natrinema salaciae]
MQLTVTDFAVDDTGDTDGDPSNESPARQTNDHHRTHRNGSTVTTVIPAYNEEQALRSVVEEYLEYSDELLVVDDGSTDDTPRIGKALASSLENVRYVAHEQNRGKANALRTGVSNAVGDIVVFTDADATYPANHISDMRAKIRAGADLVLGSRVSRGTRNIPPINMIGNRLFSFIVSFFGGVSVTDAQTGMRAMKRENFEMLDSEYTANLEFETGMTLHAAKQGYRIAEIPIDYRTRVGETKLRPIRDGWRMIRTILTILAYESSPLLQTAMALSSVFLVVGGYTGIVSIVDVVRTGDVQHDFYPLLTVLFLILAFQTLVPVLASEQIRTRLDRIEERR